MGDKNRNVFKEVFPILFYLFFVKKKKVMELVCSGSTNKPVLGFFFNGEGLLINWL